MGPADLDVKPRRLRAMKSLDAAALERLLGMLRDHGVLAFEVEGMKIALSPSAPDRPTPERAIDLEPGPATWRGMSSADAALLGLHGEMPQSD